MGTERWEASERGQPRAPQHPATVDLKHGRLSVVVRSGRKKRVLNVPLSWQLRPATLAHVS